MLYMISYAILAALTFVSAVWDLKYKKIPNIIVLPGMILGLCFSALQGKFLADFIGLLFLFVLAFFLFAFFRHWIGMGDMKLWMMCETFLGFVPSFFAFTSSQILLLIYVLMKGKRQEVSYGLRMFFRFRMKPDASGAYSLGIFFFLATVICILFLLWRGAA